MNEQQEVVFRLLTEIDKICRKNRIMYYLSPLLTLHAYMGKKFPEDPLAGVVYIKGRDMQNFRNAVEREMPENRFLDSMCVNPKFPGFYLRYTDTDTLCYCMNKGENFAAPGIGIDIFPLRQMGQNGRKSRIWNGLEVGWRQTCDQFDEKYEPEEKLWKIPVRILSLFMRRKLGNLIYSQLTCCCSKKWTDNLGIYRYSWASCPADLFRKNRDIEFEGTTFRVPSNVYQYLKFFWGKNFRRKAVPEYQPSPIWVISSNVSYSTYFNYVKRSMKDITKKRRFAFVRLNRLAERFGGDIDQIWEQLKVLEQWIIMNDRLSLQKEKMIRLYEEGNLYELRLILSEYRKMKSAVSFVVFDVPVDETIDRIFKTAYYEWNEI